MTQPDDNQAPASSAHAGASPSAPTLHRELGVFSATMLGLGSIVGTGIFVSVGIAVGVAGPSVIIAIAIAAALAVCNALSSAQLAASHPTSGGTYEYGYVYLRPWLGFAAGWMFLCAKSASAATAALGFAGYTLVALGAPGSRWHVPFALAAAAALIVVVLSGLRRSNITNIVIVSITLGALAFFIIAGAPSALANGADNLRPFFDSPSGDGRPAFVRLLEAAALMFVAYTGYGRIATLGEEVRAPRRTIPRAIIVTLIVSMVLYLAVGLVGVAAAGARVFGETGTDRAAPLAVVARGFDAFGLGGSAAAVILSIGAITAMLGVLLNLILGLSRVVLAMGRRGDLPRVFGRLSGRDKDTGKNAEDAEGAQRAAESESGAVAAQGSSSAAPTGANKGSPSVPLTPLWFKGKSHSSRAPAPTAAILLVGAVILALTAIGSVRLAWSFSAFTVLIYYAVTNLAALRLPRERRLYHPSIAWAGLAGCLSLAFWVEPRVWAAGLGVLGGGLVVRWVVRRGGR
jgi:APA family basic amino acid/polyamine antiporter